ncbi:MAG: YjbH domain-containing protein [Rhodobacteraceae bacterium]|nr:YjbH domain-containing protein [Paracoccaceae bacterium]
MVKSLVSVPFGAALALALSGHAMGQSAPSVNLYGAPGLIDMPSAESHPDAQISGTFSHFKTATKVTLGFQFTDRLSGNFRFADLDGWVINGTTEDRSFDLQYRILNETDVMPAVAIGLRDFTGNGAFGAEYIVATKSVHPKVKVTAGLGWGRLSNSSTVRTSVNPQGGVPTTRHWFDGPVGVFGGIEWITPVKGLTVKAEYSSDKYTREVAAGALNRKNPFNFGVEYKTKSNVSIGAYYLHGTEFGLRFSAGLNPKRPPSTGSMERAPLPVMARPANYDRSTEWASAGNYNRKSQKQFAQLLKDQGLQIEALALNGTSAELRLRNKTYNASAQAIGRAARVMAFVLPHSVETFVITPMVGGIPASSVVIRRSDLEALEHDVDGTEKIMQRAVFADAGALPGHGETVQDLYPKLSWSIAPYANLSLFDGSGPLRASAGIRASADYYVAPGLSFSGSLTQRVFGNQKSEVPPPSGLPRVRTDRALYRQQGQSAIERLTADYLFKPAPNMFGRVSVGYLESMFGGVSAELLWKPANQNWGLGAELNYVKQRDFNQLFGFQNYDVTTGHVSAYWQVSQGMSAQLDMGRYLAGDWGATLSVDRVFANGWRMGAFATLTDATYAQYGRGSFAKGFRLSVPLSWGIGTPNRKSYGIELNTLARDGGARLNIENRLFGLVSEYHRPELENSWARFWR